MTIMRCVVHWDVIGTNRTRHSVYAVWLLCTRWTHTSTSTGGVVNRENACDPPIVDSTASATTAFVPVDAPGGATAASDAEQTRSSPDGGVEKCSDIQELEPMRWPQESPGHSCMEEPIIDENGQFIVSRVQWPTGELAYTTPPPPDTRIAPRFGYNVLQVKKHVSWWKHYQQHPRISVAYINIQVVFLLGAAWLMAFLVEEYRRMTDELRTPGALVGEHRGRGPVQKGKQKISFTNEEMTSLLGRAQDNWMDARAEANYIGSKDYAMKKIPRPKEFSVDDFRRR